MHIWPRDPFGSCDNAREHVREAEQDARYHSHAHEPDRYDEPDCWQVYNDARRSEEHRMEEREAEEAAEVAAVRRRAEDARYEREYEEQQAQEAAYYAEQERAYWASQPEPQQPEPETQPSTIINPTTP